MQSSFHNTTNESGDALKTFRAKATAQDGAVLHFFRHIVSGYASPSECHQVLITLGFINKNTPLTSIRRSITHLTNLKKLRKTHNKAVSPYNRPEHCWETL